MILDDFLNPLHFSAVQHVVNRASIADLFRPQQRCGIYVLQFLTGEIYVGQAVDVARRYVQHRQNHPDIETIRFKKATQSDLNDIERNLIWTLEQNHFQLRNITFTSSPQGESDFDQIMSVEQQESWLLGNNQFIDAQQRIQTNELRRKYSRKFNKFQPLPFANTVLKLLAMYVHCAIPVPKMSELVFWSCSCLPGNSREKNRIIVRVNLNWQEVFNIYQKGDELITSWYLAESIFKDKYETQFVTRKPRLLFTLVKSIFKDKYETQSSQLDQQFPDLDFDDNFYYPGGIDQLHVFCTNLQNSHLVMQNQFFIAALRAFNMRLLKKGPNVYGRYHCPQLADEIFKKLETTKI